MDRLYKTLPDIVTVRHPVVDIAVFTGEETPRGRSGKTGKFRDLWRREVKGNRRESECRQPQVKPVGVTHSAGVTDAGDWIDALRGYAYDSFNRCAAE